MLAINFWKFHGFGNDYIVFEWQDLRGGNFSVEDFARTVCHRHTGIGGDGIAILEKLENETADYSCRIINPDGSEAGFSGNGTRCAVAYLYYGNLWSNELLRLKTKSGIKTYELLKRNDSTFWFRAELGKPTFDLPASPWSKSLFEENHDSLIIKEHGLLIPNEGTPGKGTDLRFVFVDVGNPVAVIFLKDFSDIEWRRAGSLIENDILMFPERTNVVFVRIVDEESIEIRIWERGAGETSSSGTCSIAAAVASAYTEKTGRKVSVCAPGGITEAVWREDGEMLITGRADLAFCGEWATAI